MGAAVKICLLAFAILSTAPPVQAQIAGASFNSSSLSVNPAASTLRPFGQFLIAYNNKNSESKVTQDLVGVANLPWKEKLAIHKAESILTAVGKVLVTEMYLSYDNVEKTTSLDQSDVGGGNQSNTDKAAFVNNMINLGAKLGKSVGIGIKYFSPTFALESDQSFESADKQKSRFIIDEKGRFTGIGFGAIYRFNPKFSMGAYYTAITRTIKGKNRFIDITGDSTSPDVEGQSHFATKGGGFAYQVGNMRKDGKRIEIGFSRMDPLEKSSEDPASPQSKPGTQIFGAGELALGGVTFGGSVRLIRNQFVDNMRLVEMHIDPPAAEDKYSPRFDYFLSLNSAKGHSFGVDGSYWSSSGMKQFQGTEQVAKTTSYSIGVSYTYIF